MTTPSRIAVSAFTTAFSANCAPAVPGTPQAGDLIVWLAGEFMGSNAVPAAPTGSPNTWTERCPHNSSSQLAAYCASALGGGQDTIPGVNWGTGFSWGVTLLLRGIDLTSVIDVSNDRRGNTTTNIVGPAGTVSPTKDNAYVLFFGAKNRTSASSGASLTAPSNFTLITSLSTGGLSQTVGLCEWIQGAKTTISAGIVMVGSLSDATNQTMEGVILVFNAGPTAPGTASLDITGQVGTATGKTNTVLAPLTARVRQLWRGRRWGRTNSGLLVPA